MKSPIKISLALSLAILTILAASEAAADWTGSRGGSGRNATASQKSRLMNPTIGFRHFLGSQVGAREFISADIDKNGVAEVLSSADGRLVASSIEGVELYRTGRNVISIEGAFDLDGDGDLEVVTIVRGGVAIFRAHNGEAIFSTPTDMFSRVGAVRIGDLDGDDAPEMYVTEMGCGTAGSGGKVGAVWEFQAGVTQGTLVHEVQYEGKQRDYLCTINDIVADVNGDGVKEIIGAGNRHFYGYSTISGRLLFVSPDVGSLPYGYALMKAADIDGDGDDELFAYVNTAYPTINSRRVFMLNFNEDSENLELVWQRSAEDLHADRHGFGPGGLEDIDGNGSWEVLTSFYDGSSDVWTTLVLDAATGSVQLQSAHGPYQGHGDLDGDGSSEIFVGDRERGASILRQEDGQLSVAAHMPRSEFISASIGGAEIASAARSGPLHRPAANGAPGSVFAATFGADFVTSEAFVAVDAGGDELARYAMQRGAVITAATLSPILSGSRPLPIVAKSDGVISAFDDHLSPLFSGVRVGGYYSGAWGIGKAPLAYDTDGDGAEEIFVIDSRRALLSIDASSSHQTGAVSTRWEILGATRPVVVEGADEANIAYWTTLQSAAIRVVNAADTTLRAQRTLGSYAERPLTDILAGDLQGDGVPELVYGLYSESDGAIHINALDSVTGAKAWAADYSTTIAGYGSGSGSLVDLDGDGALDVLASARNELRLLDGTTGELLAAAPTSYADYGILTESGGERSLVASGALRGVTFVGSSLGERRSVESEASFFRRNGVVVQCQGDTYYLTPQYQSPILSKFRVNEGVLVDSTILEDGAQISSPANAGGFSTLGNLTLSPSLSPGRGPAVTFGSTDGYLYGVDACSLDLIFAVDFGAPVGEPIFADYDGDGEDEIIVTVKDGYLYGLDSFSVPASGYVFENEGHGPALSDSEDIDFLVIGSSLNANWASVDGATEYEFNVLDEDEWPLLNEFVSVGLDLSFELSSGGMKVGEHYTTAVRAKVNEHWSTLAYSDGFTVLADPCDLCGAGTVCMDGVCVAEGDPGGTGGASNRCGCTLCCGESEHHHSCDSCGSGTSCVSGMCFAIASEEPPHTSPPRRGSCAFEGPVRHEGFPLWVGLLLVVSLGSLRRLFQLKS